MEMDPTPPSFNIQAQVPTRDIGSGYAAGIAQAGHALSDATKGVADVMQRNQNANDMLNAMLQGKMLSPDAYKSLAGKSLGAKEQMLGMYANQWILDQANQRQASLQRGQGGVEVAVQHAKLLDTVNAVRSGYGTAAGVNPKEMYWQPGQQQQPQQVQPQQQNQPQNQAQPPALQVQPQQKPAVGAPALPGTRYVQRTDPATGKIQTGKLFPGGTFIPDPGQ